MKTRLKKRRWLRNDDGAIYIPHGSMIRYPGVGGGDYVLKDSNSTENDFDSIADVSNRRYLGSSFVAGSSYTVRRVKVKLYKVGSPTFTMQAQVMADDGLGEPDGTALCTSTTTFDSSTLGEATGALITFEFDSGTALTAATRYHIVLTTSALGDSGNHVAWRINYNTATGHQISAWTESAWAQRFDVSQGVFETYSAE